MTTAVADPQPAAPPLLTINDLSTTFGRGEDAVRAVKRLTLELHAGRTLGVVGESGSGKSVTSLSVMRLLPPTARVESAGVSMLSPGGERVSLLDLPEPEMRELRGNELAMIFQEPGTSLNPVFTVGDQVMEAILQHEPVTKAEARDRTVQLFKEVGIPEPERRINTYPHEMSGGQKQRVMIAMALSCNPRLLIADEPTTALDVTIQKQILDLLRKLRDERDMAILFITHDLGVIAEIADEVAVMYRGDLVEHGPVLDIFENPKHPYTKGLLACRPRLETAYRRLPTVTDFMDVRDDGTLVAKDLTAKREEYLRTAGRGPLLHPETELETLGHPLSEAEPDATSVPEGTKPILSVRDLKVHYPIRTGVFRRVTGAVRAVDGISFDVYRGQTLGLVGESGCGKTTAGRAIVRLAPISDGVVYFNGVNVTTLRGEDLKYYRSQVQVIFQDPYASLNPRITVGRVLMNAMKTHGLGKNKQDRRDRAARLLEEVGLLPDHLGRYPHEFSGGQRQRICIARALAVEPDFIICDESVSALDVSVQAQVCNLLKDLRQARDLTYIFISHDLSVVKFMSDMMAVMAPVELETGDKGGRFVEFGPSEAIYAHPKRDYTQRLINAIPDDSLDTLRARMARRNAPAGHA